MKKIKVIFLPCKENNFLPIFLKPRFLSYYFVLLLILKILILPLSYLATKIPFFAQISKTLLLELVNKERMKRNLPPLKENPLLDKSAYLKAKDILEKDYFAHYSPDGISPWYWFKISGYDFQRAGENLAIGFLDTREVFEAWMNSFYHRKNILNPAYEDIGISVLKGDFNGNEVYLVVQHFGQKKKTKMAIKERLEKTLPEKLKKEVKKEKVTLEEKALPKELTFSVAKFILRDYSFYINVLLYLSLIFILVSISITIFVDIFVWRKFTLDYKYLIPRWFFSFLLLIFFIHLNQVKILKLIPHELKIYG